MSKLCLAATVIFRLTKNKINGTKVMVDESSRLSFARLQWWVFDRVMPAQIWLIMSTLLANQIKILPSSKSRRFLMLLFFLFSLLLLLARQNWSHCFRFGRSEAWCEHCSDISTLMHVASPEMHNYLCRLREELRCGSGISRPSLYRLHGCT